MKIAVARFVVPCVLASVSALAAGCGGAGGSDDVGTTSQALTSNEEAAYKFFIGKGLTKNQSAGIVGNLIVESVDVDPTIKQFDGGPGRGIAQWSEGGRWNASHDDNVEWYAAREHQSMYSLSLQLEFIWYELTTFGYGYSELRAASSLSAAEYAFQAHYEICGDCNQSNRVAAAERVLAANGGGGESECSLAGKKWAQNTCTENRQCDDGRWVDRYDDPAACHTGIEAHGDCLSDNGTVEVDNKCIGDLQCKDGQWVDRFDDPSACIW